MKAAVLNAFSGTFDIEEIEIGSPVGREVLLEVKACGLCHSDLHLAEANFGTPLPAVLGHEVAGIVKAVGPNVLELAVGDHVVGSLVQSCGHCGHCAAGSSFQLFDRSAQDHRRPIRGWRVCGQLGDSAWLLDRSGDCRTGARAAQRDAELLPFSAPSVRSAPARKHVPGTRASLSTSSKGVRRR
jgi:hypothetical protein